MFEVARSFGVRGINKIAEKIAALNEVNSYRFTSLNSIPLTLGHSIANLSLEIKIALKAHSQ